jgi:DNA-binding MarR family transcriptional regulator
LSVIVFAGPLPMAALAAAEQVRPPTMTHLVHGLVRGGLVERLRDRNDRRVFRIRATPKGRRLLLEGRRRRVVRLAAALAALPVADQRLLARAAGLLEQLASSPPGKPAKGRPSIPG